MANTETYKKALLITINIFKNMNSLTILNNISIKNKNNNKTVKKWKIKITYKKTFEKLNNIRKNNNNMNKKSHLPLEINC